MSRILKVYACVLVLMIGIEAVTSKRYEDETSTLDSAIEWAQANPGKAVIGAAVGASAAVVAAPYAVAAAGFGTAGIAAKSVAAWTMSWFGGATPTAGIVATLQSIGATGTVLGSGAATVATGGVGAVAGAAIAKATTDSNNKDRD